MAEHASRLATIPLVVFAALAFILWKGLYGDPQIIPSALIGKPVPDFVLPAIEGLAVQGLSTADLKTGTVTIVNIWASWCGPCREEHAVLTALSKRGDVRLVGINNKDDPHNALRFLSTMGNPFAAVGADVMGRTTIDWGTYGVPETFIIDGKGIIRYKLIGPLSAEALAGDFGVEIDKAKHLQ